MNASIRPSILYKAERPRLAQACVCCGHNELWRQPAVLMPFVAQRALGLTPVEINPSWGLRDIPCGWAHALCNTLCCSRCGLVFLDIRFSDDEMNQLYADYRGEDYTRERDTWEPGYAQRNASLVAGVTYLEETERFLTAHLSTDRAELSLLDWGGDTGRNTPMRSRARDFHIVDLSGRIPDPPAVAVRIEQAQSRFYDLVVCSAVLEHVPYPLDLLNQIKPCLHPRSLLYLEVPLETLMNSPEADRWRLKRHWHEHINFYSADSLQALVQSAGLKVLALDSIAVEIAGLPVTLLRAACQLPSRS